MDKEKLMFLSGRMQPPTRGHISLLKKSLRLENEFTLNRVILGLGNSPIDNISSLKFCEEIDDDLIPLFFNLKLTGSALSQKIRQFADESMVKNIQTRINGFRRVFLNPISKYLKDEIQRNPFRFDQREQMIRLQMTMEENQHLFIIPIAGNQKSSRMLEKANIFGEFQKIYVAPGDEYSPRTTHFLDNNGRIVPQKYPDDRFAYDHDYDIVLSVHRTEVESLSATQARTFLHNLKNEANPNDFERLMNQLTESKDLNNKLTEIIFYENNISNKIEDFSEQIGLIQQLILIDNFFKI